MSFIFHVFTLVCSTELNAPSSECLWCYDIYGQRIECFALRLLASPIVIKMSLCRLEAIPTYIFVRVLAFCFLYKTTGCRAYKRCCSISFHFRQRWKLSNYFTNIFHGNVFGWHFGLTYLSCAILICLSVYLLCFIFLALRLSHCAARVVKATVGCIWATDVEPSILTGCLIRTCTSD